MTSSRSKRLARMRHIFSDNIKCDRQVMPKYPPQKPGVSELYHLHLSIETVAPQSTWNAGSDLLVNSTAYYCASAILHEIYRRTLVTRRFATLLNVATVVCYLSNPALVTGRPASTLGRIIERRILIACRKHPAEK